MGDAPWRVCYECGHVWQTREDCEAACLAEWGSRNVEHTCPLCIHDW